MRFEFFSKTWLGMLPVASEIDEWNEKKRNERHAKVQFQRKTHLSTIITDKERL
jgi:hypothetical protein